MGLPDVDYTNPTVEKGWQHALTLPRKLWFEQNRLYQFPIEEILSLEQDLYMGELKANDLYDVKTPCFHATLSNDADSFCIDLREDACLQYQDGLLTFSLEDSGYGRDQRHIEIKQIHTIDLFSDTSSLEIFINNGEYALTTRIYDSMKMNSIAIDRSMELQVRTMDHYTIEREEEKGEGNENERCNSAR